MLYRTITAILWLTYSAIVTAGMFLVYPEIETTFVCVMYVVSMVFLGFFTLCIDKVLKILLED